MASIHYTTTGKSGKGSESTSSDDMSYDVVDCFESSWSGSKFGKGSSSKGSKGSAAVAAALISHDGYGGYGA